MKKLILLLFVIITTQLVFAQIFTPIVVGHETKVSGADGEIVFTASIEDGWHLYSTDIPEGGPTAATITFETLEGVELVGSLTPGNGVLEKVDPVFDMMVSYFEGTGSFVQKLKFKGGAYRLQGFLEYGACNDENCMPPTTYEFNITGDAVVPLATQKKVLAAPIAKEKQAEQPSAAKEEPAKVIPTAVIEPLEIKDNPLLTELWTPVTDKLEAFQNSGTTATRSLWITFLLGFGGGFLALLTPCVWPIIPMTVSFFLKRSKSRKKAIGEAAFYGISIVVIYLVLGLAVTALFGASALNALSTNAVFNIFFCALLLLFGASFLGGFELTLPSSWTNKVDEKAGNTTGLLSIFLMAFTLTLVSFSCTGPIIGFLLVEVSVTGSLFGPAVGMLGFALALALPFTLFALFPTLLKQAPRSGGWMNTIKVVLGFVEIAFALKFFSVADLAYGWRLLDRETFLAIWIILFALLGLYLLNIIRFPHDDVDTKHTSVPRFFFALLSLAFSVYMLPGLWGAPCKAISAFAPPMWTQDFNLYDSEVHPASDDYEQGMQLARMQGKPVLLDFTGYGCVNCRNMESSVWTDERVARILRDDYVLISLFVDDKTPLPEPIEVKEQGVVRKLRTIGDKWSYLQRHKFGANAQPFYVPVDNNGNPLSGSYSFNLDTDAYIKFLEQGIENYKK